MNEIKANYKDEGKFQTTKVEQRNILLIGHSCAGKSTIKSLLLDPTAVPDEQSLKSSTKNQLFESFHIDDNNMVLNIVDIPDLFERGTGKINVRDNETILRTIGICANRELTNFHAICFCVAITVGINQEDIESFKLLINFFGEGISENSCLIITQCESKDEKQRAKISSEFKNDTYFQEIAPFFKLGIFFSGSLNRDDFGKGNYGSLYDQFVTINDYRTKLIELFIGDIQPFKINEKLIDDARRLRQ